MSLQVGEMMNRVQHIEHLLEPAKLSLPAFPQVARIEVQEALDSTGEPSLFIWVLLADNTSDEDQLLEKVEPIRNAIVETVREAEKDRWPYVRFRTESEYQELVDS